MNTNERSMAEGSISRTMILFAIPVFLGQLFQQLYNTVDSLIVGRFLGSHALAAVSSSGNLIFLLVGFFNGLAMGASVVISQAFGARDYKELQKTVHTTAAMGLAVSIALTIAGTWSVPYLLRMMGTPAEVMDLSVEYFAIYFAGISTIVMYNLFSGILRAVGDSRHPLYFLVISSIVNVILDLVFITVFDWGVAGAAWATVLSQLVSCILSFWTLTHTDGVHRIYVSKIRFHGQNLWQIIQSGVPTGIQNSIISIANVVVQAHINSYGAMAMAGCGAYSRLEGFAFLPIMSFNMAISTFVGQNVGARDRMRTEQGARFGILCSIAAAELVGLIFFLAAPALISLFDSNPDVIAFGADRMRCNAPFYFLLAYSHAVSAVCRGGGRPSVPMWVMLVCWCILRVGFLEAAAGYHNVWLLYWVYPLTWGASSLFFAAYYPRKTWMCLPAAAQPETEGSAAMAPAARNEIPAKIPASENC